MNGILCPQCESKLDSGKLTKVDVEATIQLAQLSQKIPQIGKFTLNSCQESSRFSIDTDKVILETNNLLRIELIGEFERK